MLRWNPGRFSSYQRRVADFTDRIERRYKSQVRAEARAAKARVDVRASAHFEPTCVATSAAPRTPKRRLAHQFQRPCGPWCTGWPLPSFEEEVVQRFKAEYELVVFFARCNAVGAPANDLVLRDSRDQGINKCPVRPSPAYGCGRVHHHEEA